ncbi:hypothetical protein MD484_g5017, partial [Candolleomyces efflorescens]
MENDTIDDSDPFAVFMRPPEGETPAQRSTREALEAEARERSERIDEDLRMERRTKRWSNRGLLKAVLIGDHLSGKSQMLNQLRMEYGEDDWKVERVMWSCMVRLGVLKAVVTILDTLQSELDGKVVVISPNDSSATNNHFDQLSVEIDLNSIPDAPPTQAFSLNQDKYRLVMLRLGPIRRMEEKLRTSLDGLTGPDSTNALEELSEEATNLIAQCADDIKFLWEEEAVKAILQKSVVELERSAGYCRMARQAWMPFFEGVDVVMFFASLSGFNERLVEDPKVNALEGSLLLWRTICGSLSSLKPSGLIIFLTGCHLVRHKIQQGVQVKDTVPSYGDRRNSADDVTKYFRENFKATAKKTLGEKFSLHIHLVTTVDMSTTRVFLSSVKDIVLRKNLEGGELV